MLDNNAFIAFFTGEPEDNYSHKVVCPTLAQRVIASHSMNKQGRLNRSSGSYSAI